MTIQAEAPLPSAPPGVVLTFTAPGTCKRPGCGQPLPKGRWSYCSIECHRLDGNRRQGDLRVRRGHLRPKPRVSKSLPAPLPPAPSPVVRLTGARVLDHLLSAAFELSRYRNHVPGDVIAEEQDRTFSCTVCGAWATVTVAVGEDSAASGAGIAYRCEVGRPRESAYTERPERSVLTSPMGDLPW